LYHPKRVARWLETGATPGPIYTEMELTTRCNHKCFFCGVDHIVNRKIEYVEPTAALKAITGLKKIGAKSVMFSGHGEPLLHRDAARIINFAASKMSTSITTNGSPLTSSNMNMMDNLEWIRFSVNGCDPKNYEEIHGSDSSMYARVLRNVEKAVAYKKRNGLNLTIGAQLVLLKENAGGVFNLATVFKNIGVDYFSVKPYSQHPLSRNRLKMDYIESADLGDKLSNLEDESFKVVFRTPAINITGTKKIYKKCYGTHFINFISADGNVWECNVFAGDSRFLIGNIHQETMDQIWNGERRKKVLEYIANDMSVEKCRLECRMNQCNQYLWRLKNPKDHDNFI